MPDRPEIQSIVEPVGALVDAQLPKERREGTKRFIRKFYAGCPYDDLVGRDPLSLYGAAVAHLNFALSAVPSSVRVYNPQFDQHGWQSTHTVAQLVVRDGPFLVDSTQLVFNRLGLTTHLLIHPVLRFSCDSSGCPRAVAEDEDNAASRFAVMHFELDRIDDEQMLDQVAVELHQAIDDVQAAVDDWPQMQSKVREAITEIVERAPAALAKDEAEEARAFFEWLLNNNFTFLGYREYTYFENENEGQLTVGPSAGYGVLRGAKVGQISESFRALTAAQRCNALEPGLLTITKANTRSTVHRGGHMDFIGVKRWSEDGKTLVGERRFVGLYTAQAYNRSPRYVPFLRGKVAHVLRESGYPETSHAGKALAGILETFPRDVLFQIGPDELAEMCRSISHLQERQRIRLFIHPDPNGHFFSCLVYVPRDRFNTDNRKAIQQVLETALGGEAAEFTVHLSESVLVRLYFVVRTLGRTDREVLVNDIQDQLVEITRGWKDHFQVVATEHFGEARATRLLRIYQDAFRAGYRENYPPRVAVYDVEKMESLVDDDIAMSLYRPLEADPGTLRFKLFRPARAVPLSDALPMLENMGLKVEDEHPSKVKRNENSRVWIHDFGLRYPQDLEMDPALDLDAVRGRFQDCFAKIWTGEADNDGFNRLVLRAGLAWREIVVLRAYAKYLKQARVAYSQAYIEQALCDSPAIARDLIRLFVTRFQPATAPGSPKPRGPSTGAHGEALVARIEAALDDVENLDHDRILRRYLALITATLRTNYFQRTRDGRPRPYLSFKLDPARVPELPAPLPMFEMFVYSPWVEGVHLRGGPVARGGLRWSDRPEDFRTEVLGLVKAQMVKNAVIVPMGSRGGFVAKKLPSGGTRDEVMAEVVASYQTFVRGMLEITDNLDGETVVPPHDVVRLDGDDPYLVVAADKGTATFSDIANKIAGDMGFWLGDGFASGGSVGYDHKGMGITARGAWESVRRHFRELGLDTQKENFSVVGVGDMAGDVFGNGMLLSEHIELLAAFNHQHIFLDPNPDASGSFAERKRLFAQPRSSWGDYNRGLLSKGGGIFSRAAKSVLLSDEVRRVLDIEASNLTPNELISAILKARVDLLWNGGIGTYVKATTQTHADAGDRANDSLRVDAAELRCRVVGEGGNLGFTQLARVEFALAGGRINTDAIDNSAGVDCSDHEVNIKILLNAVVSIGDMTYKQRNALLSEMTDQVGTLVLANNYLQTQALSVAIHQAPAMLDVHGRLIEHLERVARLDRTIEYLPDHEQLSERASAEQGLVAPEIAVLLAYQKIHLFQELLSSSLPDDPYLSSTLANYFPSQLRDQFPGHMGNHRLRREIISTVVANEVVNRAGVTVILRLGEELGMGSDALARGYLTARAIFDGPRLWQAIESLDNQVPVSIQVAMLLEVRKLVERAARWLLRSRPAPLAVSACVKELAAGVLEVAEHLPELLSAESFAEARARAAGFEEAGVPGELALQVGSCEELYSALDIVAVANLQSLPVKVVAKVYFYLGQRLDLGWMRSRIVGLPRENRWQTLARTALRDDLYAEHRELTTIALQHSHGAAFEPSEIVVRWIEAHEVALTRCRQVFAELMSAAGVDFSMLSVAMREIRTLGRQAPVSAATPGLLPLAAD